CYCVEISDRPFVQSVYPLAVRAGESAELRMTGYNLPESPLTTFVAEADQVGVQTVELAAGSQTTNPVSLLVSDLPQLLESEEAGELAEGTRIEFPVGLNGRLETPGDVDHY